MIMRFGLFLIFFDFMPVIPNMICRITMHFLLSNFIFAYLKSEESKLYASYLSFKSEIGHLELLPLAVLKIESGTLFIAGHTLYHCTTSPALCSLRMFHLRPGRGGARL